MDVALIARFFGDKQGLFRATLEPPAAAREALCEALAAVMNGDHVGAGERLARTYLGFWEDPALGEHLLATTRSAMTSEEAMVVLREHVANAFAGHAAGVAVAPRHVGLVLAMSHLFGVAIIRYIAKVAAIADPPLDEIVGRIVPALQTYLTPVAHQTADPVRPEREPNPLTRLGGSPPRARRARR